MVRQDDFLVASDEAGPWGEAQHVLDTDLIEHIHAGAQQQPDAEVALPLAHLAHEELRSFGTSGGERLSNVEARGVIAALRAVTARLGVPFDPPFRDFETFKSHWKRSGASGSYDARRTMLDELFESVHDGLADLQAGTLQSTLGKPITPRPRTGWALVDEEIGELRRHFQAARSPQDYRNVGNDCVAVLERLSAEAYVPARHLEQGQIEPPTAKTKERLDAVVTIDLPGPANAELRKVVRAVIEQAQTVKHRGSPDRRSAGIAADSVILLANMLRRLAEPPF